jgi:hypothetical protein
MTAANRIYQLIISDEHYCVDNWAENHGFELSHHDAGTPDVAFTASRLVVWDFRVMRTNQNSEELPGVWLDVMVG